MNQRTRHYRNHRRRGMTAVLAMLFMVLAATLAVGMFAMATMNTQSGRSLSDADRARGLAESGLRWISWRFIMMNRPKTTIGAITPAVADSLWPAIRTSINNDLANMVNAVGADDDVRRRRRSRPPRSPRDETAGPLRRSRSASTRSGPATRSTSVTCA